MYTIYLKEIRSFLSSLIAYVVITVFLVAVSLFMWILKGYTVFDMGYANMDVLFQLGPYVFIFLVSAITMRSFSEERRLGTFETIATHPISDLSVIMGKYLASLSLVVFALIPTLIYYYTVHSLGNPPGNIDTGAMWGSYFGLLLLSGAYIAIGIFCSSVTDNQIVALILSMVLCFVFYSVFGLTGDIQWLRKSDLSLEWFGLDYHYDSISRGVLDTRDVVYFLSFSGVFVWLTRLVLSGRRF